jgi:hypothetical protein
MSKGPMTTNKGLLFILIFLFVFCIVSLAIGAQLNSTAAFTISGGSLTFFVAIYASEVLGLTITGAHISLQKRVDTLENENKELKKVATALIKSLYTLADSAGRLDGPLEEHKALVSKYLAPISHLIEPNVLEQVTADIAQIDKQRSS